MGGAISIRILGEESEECDGATSIREEDDVISTILLKEGRGGEEEMEVKLKGER